MEKRKIRDLKCGDIISIYKKLPKEEVMNDIENHTFRRYIVRNYNVSVYSSSNCWHEEFLPSLDNEVFYYGHRKDKWEYLSKEEQDEYIAKLQQQLRSKIPNRIYDELSKCYEVKLFGKRGVYNESGKRNYYLYIKDFLEKLLSQIEEKESNGFYLTDIKATLHEDIDTDYSRQYETECYGNKYYIVKLEYKNSDGVSSCRYI